MLNQYYASITFEDGQEKPEPSTALKNLTTHKGNAIGLDLSLTHFCIISEGKKFDNPRWFKKHEQNLKTKQQQLLRK